MEEHARKAENAEFLLRILSACISTMSFWVIAFSWNYFFEELGFVPRLGFLGAALSWVVFLHVESTGMIIMSMMRDKLRADARAEAQEELMREALALTREALAQTREAQAQAEARESQTLAEALEALTQAREAQAEAREAQAQAEAREAQLIIRDLQRQLREARGEGANGAEDD